MSTFFHKYSHTNEGRGVLDNPYSLQVFPHTNEYGGSVSVSYSGFPYARFIWESLEWDYLCK